MLVTHWGLSGPVILRLSAWGARDLFGSTYTGMNNSVIVLCAFQNHRGLARKWKWSFLHICLSLSLSGNTFHNYVE